MYVKRNEQYHEAYTVEQIKKVVWSMIILPPEEKEIAGIPFLVKPQEIDENINRNHFFTDMLSRLRASELNEKPICQNPQSQN